MRLLLLIFIEEPPTCIEFIQAVRSDFSRNGRQGTGGDEVSGQSWETQIDV